MAAWNAAQRRLAADSPARANFGAILGLIEATAWESGECLIRRRFRRADDGLKVPIQIQVLEPDYIDMSKTIRLEDGGWILHGVEFDPIGQVRGYWLFGQHPGEVLAVGNRSGLGLVSKFVPAEEVIHYYGVERPGLVRGVPALAPVILRIRDDDDVSQADKLSRKIANCLAGIVTSPEADPDGKGLRGPALGTMTADSSGRMLESFEPGMIVRLKPGEEITLNNPGYPAGFGEYKRAAAMDIATGLSMPYCLLSGDYSQSNYSSSRVGLVAFCEDIEVRRWTQLIPIVCQQVWDWTMQAAYLAGLVGSPEIPVQWDPPALDLLDRESEARADSLMLDNGTMTWPQAVSRQGYDPQEQMAEIEKWKPRVDAAGIVYATVARAAEGGTNSGKASDQQSK